MKTLKILSRTRYKKLYNILPESIARKACPPFFTTVKEPYIDWLQIKEINFILLFKGIYT